ncbi:two-component system sensor histidine kinase NtrB [Desulfosarcina ovata]|uniref:histidine kinase n=1 Tax=Desulfosarcina ovata subsp. ovata TaxID=2752305 RepID=A0A5K8AJ95_9BACT|nr:ATP-binding protein [Desulfosarcina ovata]BBO92773.1 sensor histidine kinase [Desulfosarcina ovata subsp. ovata]
MGEKPKIEDLIGLGHSKLGFYKEVQEKIAELRKSNRALEHQRQHVQAILDGITDIVAVISPDYRIASVNHSFFEIYSQDSPEGGRCYDVFRGRGKPCHACVLRDALERNCVCRQDAMIAVGDHYRHFSITAAPLRDSRGLPTDILVVKRDVTLEKEFQAKYYHAEKMATIGLLAAGVAHEINNPLTSIRGFAEGLQRRMATLADAVSDDALKSDFAEYLEIILKECRRCSGIVRSLLTFSPRRSPEFSRIGLNELVRNVLRILHHKLKQYPDRLIQRQLDEALPTIQANAAELEQVILNLILNAIDAVEAERGAIVIRTRVADERRVLLEIEDNGCGIAPEDQQKLFEPFFTTKPVGKGIGIGLSTCYHIIQSHGGEIQVASTPGQGACFSVVLPVTLRSGES